jgi:hypothetical protein
MSQATEVKEVTVIDKVIALMGALEKFEAFETSEITIDEVIQIKHSIERILSHRLKK